MLTFWALFCLIYRTACTVKSSAFTKCFSYARNGPGRSALVERTHMRRVGRIHEHAQAHTERSTAAVGPVLRPYAALILAWHQACAGRCCFVACKAKLQRAHQCTCRMRNAPLAHGVTGVEGHQEYFSWQAGYRGGAPVKVFKVNQSFILPYFVQRFFPIIVG